MKQLLLFAAFLLFSFLASAQVPHPPCVPPNFTGGRGDCPILCTYCQFDGYSGSTALTLDLSHWQHFCGVFADVTSIGFVASTDFVTITATPNNCLHGDGLQIGAWDDCNNGPIACDVGGPGNGIQPVEISFPTIPGTWYMVSIGGYAGDQCGYNLVVSPPGAAIAPVPGDIPSEIEGGLSVLCPGGTATYSLELAPNTGGYIWTAPSGWLINGLQSPVPISGPSNNSVQITAGPNPGQGQVCAMAVNACYPAGGDTICRTFEVVAIPPTYLEDGTVCKENLPYVLPWGDLAYATGSYSATVESFLGCDSIVNQHVVVFNNYTNDLGTIYLCEGSVFSKCGQDFTTEGFFSAHCQTYQGCDSTINFKIQFVLAPVAQINGNQVLDCATNSILLTAEPSPFNTTFKWHNSTGQLLSTTGTCTVTTAGTYFLYTTLNDNGTVCSMADSIVITYNPTQPTLNASGGTLSCTADSLQLMATSNAISPSWSWVGPGGFVSTLANPVVSLAGTYSVTVTSASSPDCTAIETISVANDTVSPTLVTTGATLTCSQTSAPITANAIPANAMFLWSGPNGFSSSLQAPTINIEGTYTVTVTNASNGCIASATTTVALNNLMPGASALGGTVTCSSPTLVLMGNSPNSTVTYAWTGPDSFISSQQNPSVSDAGTYILTVSDTLNGCLSTTSTTVLADQTAPVASSTAGTLTCSLDSLALNGNANVPATYAWSGPNGFFSALQNPVVVVAGDYVLVAIASNGCADTLTVSVAQDITSPGAVTAGDTIDCNNPQAQISVTSQAGITYAWTGPNNFTNASQDPVVSVDGNYFVTVTGLNGCTSSNIAFVELDVEHPELQSSVPDTLTCLLTSANIQATINTPVSLIQLISWTGPGGFVSSLEDPIVSAPGVYTLMVTSTNGCSSTVQAMVLQDTIAPDISAQGGALSCAVTSLNLNGGSSAPGVAFIWLGPNNFSSSLEDPAVSEGGIYALTVTGTNGCISTAETFVVQDIAPPDLAAFSTNDLDCTQLTTSLNASSQTDGVNYLWTGPSNFTASTATTTTVEPGIYQIAVTGLNGCISMDSVIVAQDIELPGVSVMGSTIDCITGQASLTGNSPSSDVSYVWTGPSNFTSTLQNPSASQAGTYTLTVTGVNGCSSTATALVEENTLSPDVMLNGGGTLTCSVLDVILTGTISTAGATGVWNGPNNFTSNQPSITVSVPGIYTYTVTAPNGCISAPTSTVLEDMEVPQGITTTGGMLDCSFPSIHLGATSSTAGVTYAWTGPGNFSSNLPNPAVTNPGIYTLVVTKLVNGCTSSATAEVTQDPTVPDITVASDSLTCLMQTVTLDATSAIAGVAFAWAGPNGFVSFLEDPSTDVPGLYALLVTAPNGCSVTFNYVLTQNISLPDVSAQGDTLSCNSSDGQITSSSNTLGVAYAWTGPGGFVSNIANPTVTLSGDYTVVVSSPNGCSSAANVTVTPDINAPVISASGGTLTCLVTSIDLSASSNITVDWQWNGPGGFNATIENPNISIAGNYSVVATAFNGCSTTSTVTVFADTQSPSISIEQPDKLDCTTEEVGLHVQVLGNVPFDYQWGTQNGVIISGANTANPQVSQAGNYQVVVTNNANGCSTAGNVTVEIDPATPSGAALEEIDISCFGKADGSIVVHSIQGGTPPLLYSIDNQAFTSNTLFTSLSPGNHILLVQDANGCEYQTTFELLEPEELTVNLGPDTIIQLGDAIWISSNVVNFPDRVKQMLVTPSGLQLDSVFQPIYSLDYSVTVLDSNGCEARDQRTIEVDRKRHIYIPNIFNPNSGFNPALYVFGGEDVAEIEWFQIYDRWGDRVFEQFHFEPNDPAKGWSGRFRGSDVNPGVFVYLALVRFIDGEQKLFRGDVTVLR